MKGEGVEYRTVNAIMSRKAFLTVLLSAIVLSPITLPAQDSGCTQRTIAVGVVDGAWNLVPDLSAANFRGKLRGHDVRILSAAVDTSPRRIVLLLDASGSMMDSSVGGGWKTEKAISQYLIQFAPPRASIAFIAFSRTILESEGFDDEPQALLQHLSALVKVCEQPRKGPQVTALFDAISRAGGTLGVCKLGDVICTLTDAGDNKSLSTARRVEAELLNSGVRLFGIVTIRELSPRARAPEEATGPEQLHSMIEATGGNTLFVPYVAMSEPYINIRAKTAADAADLALQRLFRQMGEFYRLEVRLPEKVDKPTKWKLEVLDANGKPMRGVEVHYPQELMPCAKASP